MTPQTKSADQATHDKRKGSLLETNTDLWGIAYCQLATDNRPLVENYEQLLKKETGLPANTSIQERAEAILLLKRNQILRKQWKLQWGHRSIKIRAQIDRIVKLVDAFKDIGSSVASVDPVHAGLPWAGVCILLVVSLLTSSTRQGPDRLSSRF